MKKFLVTILAIISLQAFTETNSDSLWNVINSPAYSDSLKLEAWEDITKSLIHENKDSCRKLCHKGLTFAKSLKNKRFEWSFYNRIGITYFYESNYEKAVEYWIKSLKVAEKANDAFALSQNINNLAYAFDMVGDYPNAIKFYKRAILMKELKYHELMHQINNVKGPKEKEKLETNLNRGLMAMGMQKINAAIAYGRLKEYDSTGKYLAASLEILDELKGDHNRHQLLTNIGSTYAFLGSHQDVRKFLFDALKYYLLAEKYIDTSEVVVTTSWLINVGEIYFYLDDFEKGIPYIKKAQKLSTENKLLRKQETIYEVLANYYFLDEDYKHAYFYKDSGLRIKDSINLIDQQKAIEEIQTKYQTEKKERENLELKQEVREQEIEMQRQRTMRNIFIGSTSVFLIFVLIISYLFSRLRLKNKQLTKSKAELEKLNLNLNKSKEETEKALEFKSLFLANMSHEIRTPLNIIIGFNSILKKQIDEPKLLKHLQSIEMSSYNLLRFLNDILDMSKIEAGKIHLTPESINLKLLIMNIKELFILKAREKNLELTVDIDPKMPNEIVIDEIRLRQIMVNLIGNAIKFTEEGYVKVIADAPVLNNFQSEFSTRINVRIRVEDSGIGIADEDVHKIFESFRQVNLQEQKEMGGTGLGLAISKRLTEMMNGEISVESKKGKGSVFTILFREVQIGMSTESKTEKKTRLAERLEYEFTGGTILVADDEEMNRSLIKVCFENTDVTVLEAANGDQTLELTRKHKPDIIMMDIKMPGLDGLEATRILKNDEKYRNIPVIAFSASNIFDRLEKDEISMFSGLISKPVLLDELYEKASKILPHKIKEKPTAKKETITFSANSFRDEDFVHESESGGNVLHMLKNNWSKTYSTNSMNKILEFTNEMEDFAVKNNLPGLKKYAVKIREAGKNFDIAQVKQLLKLFPELLQKAKP